MVDGGDGHQEKPTSREVSPITVAVINYHDEYHINSHHV